MICSLVDPWVCRRHAPPPPLPSQFLRFDIHNFQNVGMLGVGTPHPIMRLVPHPTRNPGSATDVIGEYALDFNKSEIKVKWFMGFVLL